MKITEMSREELQALEKELAASYADYQALGLKLDMSRGKPGPTQLDLTNGLLSCLTPENINSTVGDIRNYGFMDGIPEIKEIFADLFNVPAEQQIIGGNASLNLMYDAIARLMQFGTMGNPAWNKLEGLKWLCPAPGYDRHFAITELFGFEMITVPMTVDGPDMDVVEELVKDEKVKGIWCVPLYSNPGGICYSDEVVRRLGAMGCAAPDFRIFWDNAYGVHHLYAERQLADIFEACRVGGNEDRPMLFCSTSKITFPGAGVSMMAASPAVIAETKKLLTIQTISYDKINQMRHVRFFGDADGVRAHMKKLAGELIPKFDIVLNTLDKELGGTGLLEWNKPDGGYFIAVDTIPGCAKETVKLAKEAGVAMTGAGATYPYKNDPQDTNIRIAPTYPSEEELQKAIDLFCLCVKLAGVRKLLAD